jgi:hypothetical protein
MGCRISCLHMNFCGTQKGLARLRDLLIELQGLEPHTSVSFSFRVTRSNANIGRVLEGLRSIRMLDMFSNVICDTGMALLSRAIPSLVTLRCLDLTSNLISHTGMARLAAALPRLPRLRRLRLGGNNLSDASLRRLAPALAALRSTLTELDLNGNRLSPAGLAALAAALCPLTALRDLDLSCTGAGRPLADPAVALLAAALSRLRRLETLLLYDTAISDCAVLASLVPALSRVTLSGATSAIPSDPADDPAAAAARPRRLRHLGISGVSPAARAALERVGREAGFAVTEEVAMLQAAAAAAAATAASSTAAAVAAVAAAVAAAIAAAGVSLEARRGGDGCYEVDYGNGAGVAGGGGNCSRGWSDGALGGGGCGWGVD